MSADIVLKRYLYLHAAVLFVLTSVIGRDAVVVAAVHVQ